MKVFCVCPACDDFYYGYLKPVVIFTTQEKALAYAKEHYSFDYNECQVMPQILEMEVQE
jgi:hypothetical protein